MTSPNNEGTELGPAGVHCPRCDPPAPMVLVEKIAAPRRTRNWGLGMGGPYRQLRCTTCRQDFRLWQRETETRCETCNEHTITRGAITLDGKSAGPAATICPHCPIRSDASTAADVIATIDPRCAAGEHESYDRRDGPSESDTRGMMCHRCDAYVCLACETNEVESTFRYCAQCDAAEAPSFNEDPAVAAYLDEAHEKQFQEKERHKSRELPTEEIWGYNIAASVLARRLAHILDHNRSAFSANDTSALVDRLELLEEHAWERGVQSIDTHGEVEAWRLATAAAQITQHDLDQLR